MAFQRRKVELPAGFLELGSSETPPSTSYDWVCLGMEFAGSCMKLTETQVTSSNPARTIISPPDVVLSNLYPLPSVGRGTATIGTMQTPDGPKLISLDVLGSTGKADGDAASDTAAAWTAATGGPPAPLPAGLWNNPVLAISQSVERGCMGLVGAWAPDEAMYFVDASVEPGKPHHTSRATPVYSWSSRRNRRAARYELRVQGSDRDRSDSGAGRLIFGHRTGLYRQYPFGISSR